MESLFEVFYMPKIGNSALRGEQKYVNEQFSVVSAIIIEFVSRNMYLNDESLPGE